MVKTQKSKLLQSFAFAPLDFTDLQNYTAVVYMVFFWRLCMPTAEDREKGDETKYTWADYANKIFFTITNQHLNVKTVIFVNDPYGVIDLVKAEEQKVKTFTSRQLINFQIRLIFQHFSPINQIRLQNYLKVEFQKLSQ